MNGYYITLRLNNKNYIDDVEVATCLGLKPREYQDILLRRGTNLFNADCYFKYIYDVEEVVKYLNNEYGILLKLLTN